MPEAMAIGELLDGLLNCIPAEICRDIDVDADVNNWYQKFYRTQYIRAVINAYYGGRQSAGSADCHFNPLFGNKIPPVTCDFGPAGLLRQKIESG